MCRLIISVAIVLVLHQIAHSACESTYPYPVSTCTSVSGVIHIPGGTDSYTAATPNREYILDGDLTTDGQGITISASNIVINLNGHTLTYNQTAPGYGVSPSGYGFSNVAITNGSIVQGSAKSTGGVYGAGNNPVRTSHALVTGLHIIAVEATYSGQDVAGFMLNGQATVDHCTLTDAYGYGVVADRHSGISAIRAKGSGSIVTNNTIIDARNRGIEVGVNAIVADNIIGLKSICTNSAGVFLYGAQNAQVYNNVITGRGEHPLGIIAHGAAEYPSTSTGYRVYNNTIDIAVTQLGVEYTSQKTVDLNSSVYITGVSTSGIAVGHRVLGNNIPASTTVVAINGTTVEISNAATVTKTDDTVYFYPAAFDPETVYSTDHGVGIRSTNGVFDLDVYDNNITVNTDSNFAGTFSVTGEAVTLATEGRGLMAGLRDPGQSATFRSNTITMIDADGNGSASGIACDANDVLDGEASLIFFDNTVTSDLGNIALGDSYGYCYGHPLFIQNTLIKSATAWPNYHTIVSGEPGTWGYYSGTGRFIDNIYQGGAAQTDLYILFNTITDGDTTANGTIIRGVKSLIFGYLQPDNYMFYENELHNSLGTTGSATPINTTLNQLGELFTLDPVFDTTPPISASNKSGRYQSTQTVTLSANETATTTYCTGAGCDPIKPYIGPLTDIMKNNALTILRFKSTDSANNEETVQEVILKKQRRR